MKHTEQDQPIHVNADRDYDAYDNWNEDLGPDYPFGTNTSFEGWDMHEDPFADTQPANTRECVRDDADDAYAAIAEDVPEWHDDEVFVDWYIDVLSVYGNIAEAREYVDREYREYLQHMEHEGAYEAKRDGKEEA